MTVLVTGPGGADLANATLKRIGQTVCSTAPEAATLVELWDEDATRSKVDTEMANNPDVFYFGHGSPYSLGHNEPLIDAENIDQASGRIVLAMACSSAADLGPYAIEGGRVRAYLGFVRKIIVPGGRYSKWQIEPWASAGSALLAGKTAGEALNNFKTALTEEGDRLAEQETSLSFAERVAQAGQVIGWGASLVCLGDVDGRLEP